MLPAPHCITRISNQTAIGGAHFVRHAVRHLVYHGPGLSLPGLKEGTGGLGGLGVERFGSLITRHPFGVVVGNGQTSEAAQWRGSRPVRFARLQLHSADTAPAPSPSAWLPQFDLRPPNGEQVPLAVLSWLQSAPRTGSSLPDRLRTGGGSWDPLDPAHGLPCSHDILFHLGIGKCWPSPRRLSLGRITSHFAEAPFGRI